MIQTLNHWDGRSDAGKFKFQDYVSNVTSVKFSLMEFSHHKSRNTNDSKWILKASTVYSSIILIHN